MQVKLSSENTWSDIVDVSAGKFNLSIWGTFVATITVQRTFDGGTTWLDVETITSPNELVGEEGEGMKYRIGIKTGDYTSGDINIRMAN